MRCPCHLSTGQETAAVGLAMALEKGDHVYGSHRSHAIYLAMGGSVDALIAELHGKATGCAHGWGGSMHISAPGVGFMGTSAIVGSSIPLALGSAQAFQLSYPLLPIEVTAFGEWPQSYLPGPYTGPVAVAIFGDGALESGVLYESINYAALHKLPIMFVCENNRLAAQTPLEQRQPDRNFCNVARAMGLVYSNSVKDLDVSAIWHLARLARKHTPSYLEIQTHRWYEHCGPLVEAKTVDPLRKLEMLLLCDGMGNQCADIEAENQAVVDTAFKRAEEAAYPKTEALSAV